jgi:chromosome segregation ATPase
MKKYSLLAAGLGSAIALALAMTASAQVSATAANRISVSGIASTTLRARIEARYGTSTPPGTHMSSTTRMQMQQNRITTVQNRSDSEITARINSLNSLVTRLGSMKNISSSQIATFTTDIQTEIANLTSLKAAIDADTSTSTLKTDYQSITQSYRIYALVEPQVDITAAADRVLTLSTDFSAIVPKIQSYVNTAQTNGTNVSAAVSALADLSAKTSDATTQANAAVAEVAGLQPDQGATSTMEANTAALKDAQSKIKTATSDLDAARKDVTTAVQVIRSVINSLTGTSPKTTVSGTTTTTVTASTTQ